MQLQVNSLAIILSAVVLLVSCKENADKSQASDPESRQAAKENNGTETAMPTTKFDITSVAVSENNIGQFPYFSAPEGMEVQVEKDKEFHRIYHVINGTLTPIEGRTYAIIVRGKSYGEFEPLLFEKNYENLIKSAGGVLVSDGRVQKSEIERVDKDEYFKYRGVADIYNEPVKAYVIRRPQSEIWIQISSNNASGNVTISETGEMKQTSKFINADEIKQQLDANGKAVLYIQFDTDKASLQPDGEQAVNEIAKLLTANKDIKLAINGHTDNSGSDDHNLKLSKDRAATVLSAVVKSGVEKSRLTSDGFGASNPIAENTSEEGKAKNRRVELIKK